MNAESKRQTPFVIMIGRSAFMIPKASHKATPKQ
jgi:hypothetical protein